MVKNHVRNVQEEEGMMDAIMPRVSSGGERARKIRVRVRRRRIGRGEEGVGVGIVEMGQRFRVEVGIRWILDLKGQ
jgi:hypothetical protein